MCADQDTKVPAQVYTGPQNEESTHYHSQSASDEDLLWSTLEPELAQPSLV